MDEPTRATGVDSPPGGRDRQGLAVRNTIANGFSRIVALGLSFLLTPVVLQGIGTEAFGLWVLVGSIVGYGSLLNLGIGGAVTKYVAEHRSRGEGGQARATVVAARRLYLRMGALAAIAGIVLAAIVPLLLAVPSGFESLAQVTTALMAIGLGTGIACSTPPAVLRGLQRYDVAAVVAVVTSVLSAGATLAAIALGWGLVGIVALGVPLPIVTQFLAAAAVRRLAPDLGPAVSLVAARPVADELPGEPGEGDRALARRILGFSWPLLVLDIAGMLQSRTDEIVVGVVLSLGAVTPYSLGHRLATIPRLLAEQFAILLLPLASELDALQEREHLRRLYLGGVRLSLAIAMPLAGCLLLLSVPILDVWVGPGFEDGARIIVILVVATVIDLSLWPAGFVLQGIDRHRWLAPISLASGLANLGLSLALAGPFGIVGVAFGTLIPTTIEAVVLLTPFTLRTLGIGPTRFISDAIGPALLPLAPAVAALMLAAQLVPPTSALAIIVLVALAHVVYGAVYLAAGPTAPERALARTIVIDLVRLGQRLGR